MRKAEMRQAETQPSCVHGAYAALPALSGNTKYQITFSYNLPYNVTAVN